MAITISWCFGASSNSGARPRKHGAGRCLVALCMAGVSILKPVTTRAAIKVVTTTTDLRSIVESIGGDHVEASSLSTGQEDPHFIDAKPSCMILAKDADLWIRIGMELEIGYENLVIDGSRNPRIRSGSPGHLDAAEGVLRLEVPTGKIDRSMGDVHPQGNPHYWLDPLNGRIIAKSIANRLAKLDPPNADDYLKRLAEFQAQLDERMFGPKLIAAAETVSTPGQGGAKLWALLLKRQIDPFVAEHDGEAVVGGWWGAMRPLREVKIVTYHRSWSYFANRFGLQVIAELEPKPGIEPSPAHLAEVLSIAEQQHVSFLLIEPFYSRQAPDWLASRTGMEVVQVANSVGGQPEATDYLSMIDNIVRRCVKANAEAGKGKKSDGS